MIVRTRKCCLCSKQGKFVADAICDVCNRTFTSDHCVKAFLESEFHCCSRQCARKSPRRRTKLQASLSAVNEQLKARLKATCLERYGVESYFQTDEFRSKREKALLERYGVTHQSKSPIVVAKQQRARGKVTLATHWKTHAVLNCEGSYERVFVGWCNLNQIDFDWQIPMKMPDGRVYFIDAFIKSGEFADTWIELKGYMSPTAQEKWDWFQEQHSNAELWDYTRLHELGLVNGKRPNPLYLSNAVVSEGVQNT